MISSFAMGCNPTVIFFDAPPPVTNTFSDGLNFISVPARFGAVGRTFHYQCTQCRYRARISGGTDSGRDCDVQTIICRECRELFDVFTRVRRVAGQNESAKNFSAFVRVEIPPVILQHSLFAQKRAAPRRFEWQKIKLECPVAAKHFVEAWKDPGRCPRCHAFMEAEGLPFRVWE
jgi:hypothetical protein